MFFILYFILKMKLYKIYNNCYKNFHLKNFVIYLRVFLLIKSAINPKNKKFVAKNIKIIEVTIN